MNKMDTMKKVKYKFSLPPPHHGAAKIGQLRNTGFICRIFSPLINYYIITQEPTGRPLKFEFKIYNAKA